MKTIIYRRRERDPIVDPVHFWKKGSILSFGENKKYTPNAQSGTITLLGVKGCLEYIIKGGDYRCKFYEIKEAKPNRFFNTELLEYLLCSLYIMQVE